MRLDIEWHMFAQPQTQSAGYAVQQIVFQITIRIIGQDVTVQIQACGLICNSDGNYVTLPTVPYPEYQL